MKKLSFPLHPHNLLVRWCNLQRGFYGYPIYLVGSQVTDKENPRDVDICCILPDDIFCKRFGVKDLKQFLSRMESGLWDEENWSWSDDMVHHSLHGCEWTKMNIDFKVISNMQDMTEYKDKPKMKLDTREDE
jgi:hypothetical protein